MTGGGKAPGTLPPLTAAFRRLTGHADWRPVAAHRLRFDAHHPQGMARVGDALFVSSVEVIEPPRPCPRPASRGDGEGDGGDGGGPDRSAGRGVGHLFKLGLDGGLLGRITLGAGDAYHPGGIDGDDTGLWVPVAEYRPDSRAVVYRVDPATMAAIEVFHHPDHIGAVAWDPGAGELHGVSWGSRRFYTWRPRGAGSPGASTPSGAAPRRRPNPAHYIDYQDCQHVGGGLALCSGLAAYRPTPGGPELALGGMELVDLRRGRPVHQIPVRLWTEAGLPLTRNPVWAEARAGGGLRVYFMPEDGAGRLFVYEVAVPDVPSR